MDLRYKIIPVLFLLSACEKPDSQKTVEFHSVGDLQKYLMDPSSGLSYRHEVNGISVLITFSPKDLLLAKKSGNEDQHKTLNGRNRIDEFEFFSLEFLPHRQEHRPKIHETRDFSEHESYLVVEGVRYRISQMQQYKSSDEVLGKLGPTSYLLVVRAGLLKLSKEFTIEYYDKEFGTGQHTFRFQAIDLNRIPPLSIGKSRMNSRQRVIRK